MTTQPKPGTTDKIEELRLDFARARGGRSWGKAKAAFVQLYHEARYLKRYVSSLEAMVKRDGG